MSQYNFLPSGITPLPGPEDNTFKGSGNPGMSMMASQWIKKRQLTESPEPIPTEFENTMKEINAFIREKRRLTANDIVTIKTLLDRCYMDDPVCTFQDEQGYDIVQKSVALDALPVLEYLVLNNYDLALNTRMCSSPLFLACKNNNTQITKFLLEKGASILHPSSQCYPKPHSDKSRKSKSIKTMNICYDEESASNSLHGTGLSDKEKFELTPLYAAVKYDRPEILELLLVHKDQCCDDIVLSLLEKACKIGAENCLQLLLKVTIHCFDESMKECSNIPNFLFIAFSHSEEMGLRLLKEAANLGISSAVVNATINVNSKFSKCSILHAVYSIPYIMRYFDITKNLIASGLDVTHINARDPIGRTPIHSLMLQVGVKAMANPTKQIKESSHAMTNNNCGQSLEEQRQEQLFATVQYLLSLGANIDVITDLGESILHVLFDNVNAHNFGSGVFREYGVYVGTQVQPKVNRFLEFLLRKGADVNRATVYGSTVLFQLINSLGLYLPSDIDDLWVHYWYAFNLLFKYGADPNVVDRRGISAVSVLLTTVHRWLQSGVQHGNDEIDMDLPCRLLDKIKDMLWLMFRSGLKPSGDVLELSVKQTVTLCNISIHDDHYLDLVKDLLVPFFSHGVNPNTMPIVYHGEESAVAPCRLHAQFYLTRAFMIHYNASGSFLRFFQIFMDCLHQRQLNTLLRGVQKILRENFEMDGSSSACYEQVEQLKHTVRPLRSLCRLSISQALGWHLTDKSILLPLPKLLQLYIQRI